MWLINFTELNCQEKSPTCSRREQVLILRVAYREMDMGRELGEAFPEAFEHVLILG